MYSAQSGFVSVELPAARADPPYLHPPVSAVVRCGGLRSWLAWSSGWLSLLPVPDSCRILRAGGSQGRAAPAQRRRRRFAEAAASDEAYQELLARTLTIAQDTAMRDKRRALGRALANALDETGTSVDDEVAFVRMLADLNPVHIRVLKIMSRRPIHLDRVAVQMNAADDPKAARQWYEWSIVAADPGLEASVHGALRVLKLHGLIWDRGEQLVPPPHGMQHEYEISPYGDYLIDRLAAPD